MSTTAPRDASSAAAHAHVLEVARATTGFMPDEEGLALARTAGLVCSLSPEGGGTAIVEVGAYCGRSTLYLAHGVLAALAAGGGRSDPVIFSLDHHHGSEENQAGWEHHDASLVNPETGRLDTLPAWRRAVEAAGVEDRVVGLVGDSPTIAACWRTPLAFCFIDGGHGSEPAWADYRGWAPHVTVGSLLAIHDVFPDPAEGGRPPFEVWTAALAGGEFAEDGACGSLRVLRRVAPPR